MQSLETSFFLIALHRYPHALSTCASALEAAIKASLACPPDGGGLQSLIEAAKEHSACIGQFPRKELDAFRRARNRLTHEGFSPKDDSESAALLIKVGLPFLALCFRELHSFDLMEGLLQKYAEHFSVATKVYENARNLPDVDLAYCFASFGHLIRWCFKSNFSVVWEIDALLHAEEVGAKFERTYQEKQELERVFGAYWSFDCPICDDVESVACELDESELVTRKIALRRMACTNCGFVVRDQQPFLSQVLLEGQVSDLRVQILREHGLQ
jgi:transcription elongation factor Elf1